jgi:hypothetical protein
VISGSRDGAFGSALLSHYAAGMTKAHLIRGIRWIITGALLFQVALHAHWSVTTCLVLIMLAIEALTPAIFRVAVGIENLQAVLKMNGVIK